MKLKHGDKVNTLDGQVTYVERGKARGFLVKCGSFYGLRELFGYLKNAKGDFEDQLKSLPLFEQAVASGMVDVEASSRRAESAQENAMSFRIRGDTNFWNMSRKDEMKLRRKFFGLEG
jgi:hypothetical protein